MSRNLPPRDTGPWVGGSVTVRLEGPRVSQALSRALERGIPVYAIRPLTDQTLEVVLPAGQLQPFRHAVRGRHTRIRILGRRGAVYAAYRLARRPGLWLGAGLCAVVLLWASTQVWAVRVEGARPRLGAAVLRDAKRLGLHPGVVRGAVDRASLARALERQVKGLSWVGVDFDGGLVVIRAVPELRVPPAVTDRAEALVAWHGGTVRRVILTQGIADVKPGDEVRPGQVLAQGYSVQGSNLRSGEPGPTRYVAPRGSVWATFTATAVVSVPAQRTKRQVGGWAPVWQLSVGSRVLTQRDMSRGKGSGARLEGRTLLDLDVVLPYIGPVRATVLRVRLIETRTVAISTRVLLPQALRQAQAAVERQTGVAARVVSEKRQIQRIRDRLVLRLTDTVEANVARPDASHDKAE